MFATKRHLKVALFTALAVLLVSSVGVYVVHATHSADKSGEKNNVRWELSVGHLDKEHGWAYSEHHFDVQNKRAGRITVEWEFSHKLQLRNVTNFDLPDDTIDGSFTLDGGTSQYYSSLRNTPYDHLNVRGQLYLEAYTRLDIRDVVSHTEIKKLDLR